ncbi:MAG: F0F1 ATP synthase subunit A [Bacilli bacterium]|nr:F0F1 ATP synthase subunit A [Bacilli bacterium]
MMILVSIETLFRNISPSIKSSMIITFILAIILIIIGIKLRKYKVTDEPKGLIIVIEWLVETMNDMTKSTIGKRYKKLAPYLTTVAIMLFVYNISGLFGFRPPTASVSVTFAFSITTFVLVEFYGIRSQGIKKHLKGYLDPIPLFLPMNIISDIAIPISLGLRLFGNILSGVVIMALVYTVLGWAALAISPVLHLYFDLFSGFIQTLVFCMLTLVFIAGKLPDEEVEYFDNLEEN